MSLADLNADSDLGRVSVGDDGHSYVDDERVLAATTYLRRRGCRGRPSRDSRVKGRR